MTKAELKQQIHQAIDKRAEEIVGLGEHDPKESRARLQGGQDRAAGRGDAAATWACRRKGGLALTGVRADVAGRGRRRPDLRAARRARRARRRRPPGRRSRRPARRTPAATTPRWPGCWARPWACSTPGRSSTWPAAWCSSPCPPRSTATSSGASRRRAAGRLEFLGGKPELMRLGHFDDVDLAMMIHTTSRAEDGKAGVPASNNGCIVKTVRYIGRASHAGGAPHMGINALYAAQIGAHRHQRAPRDLPRRGHHPRAPDHHPRRLAGERDPGRGAARDLRARAQRGGDPRRQQEGGPRLRAGALALGAKVEIETLPGYMPMSCDPTMTALFKDNAASLVGAEQLPRDRPPHRLDRHGRPQHVMPTLHPYMGGATGRATAPTTQIADQKLAYVGTAKALGLDGGRPAGRRRRRRPRGAEVRPAPA